MTILSLKQITDAGATVEASSQGVTVAREGEAAALDSGGRGRSVPGDSGGRGRREERAGESLDSFVLSPPRGGGGGGGGGPGYGGGEVGEWIQTADRTFPLSLSSHRVSDRENLSPSPGRSDDYSFFNFE